MAFLVNAMNASVVKEAPPIASSLSHCIFFPTTAFESFLANSRWRASEILFFVFGIALANTMIPSRVLILKTILSFPAGLMYVTVRVRFFMTTFFTGTFTVDVLVLVVGRDPISPETVAAKVGLIIERATSVTRVREKIIRKKKKYTLGSVST